MAFRPKILVVDDDPKALETLEEALTRMGADPHCMSSGLLATNLIHRDRFDGILVDAQIPEISGLDLVQRVRKSRANAKCPIISDVGKRACYISGDVSSRRQLFSRQTG